VLERARAKSVSELPSLTTNDGGVAIAASCGVQLTAINTEVFLRTCLRACHVARFVVHRAADLSTGIACR